MSKRLQVLVDEAELEAIRASARRHGKTVSEWVRDAMRKARRDEPNDNVARKLEAIRRAAEHQAPTGDIEQILAEIEQGYLSGPP